MDRNKIFSDIEDFEKERFVLKVTTPLENLPAGLREDLSSFYNSSIRNARLLAVLINATWTAKCSTFLMSKRIFNGLLKADGNLKSKSISGTNFKHFSALLMAKFLNQVTFPTHRKAGVYEWKNKEVLVHFKEFEDTKEKVVAFYNSDESEIKVRSGSSKAPSKDDEDGAVEKIWITHQGVVEEVSNQIDDYLYREKGLNQESKDFLNGVSSELNDRDRISQKQLERVARIVKSDFLKSLVRKLREKNDV